MASVKAIEARGFSFRYPESTAGIGPLDWAVEEGAFQLRAPRAAARPRRAR